ncbi:O-methyltransferase [Candidatus Bipolaricaulota bacterium]|nr:O-methyltransferase [Candidatus Bipolaricaulota bacterium]
MALEKINTYIAGLYTDITTRTQYMNETELKEFVPVVDDDVARLLKMLLYLTRARRVLEIGTSIGYSTTSMAQVVKEYDGRIITVEFDEQVAGQARRNFEQAGVSDFVEVLMGDALKIVPQLEEGFDFIFLDVDKRLYAPLLAECVRLLKKGGLLVAEDTLFPVIDLDQKWHHLIAPIEEFNHLVSKHEGLASTVLPIGDGVTVAVKK